MTTYNTYQEAKIANPECEVVTTGSDWNGDPALAGRFQSLVKPNEEKSNGFHIVDGTHSWVICNPADCCMTVEKFLADGNVASKGDWVIDSFGNVWMDITESGVHCINNLNKERASCSFILRAAALEEEEPELTKDDSPQGVISAISNRLHNIGCEHQDSELGEELGSMACDIWGVLPLISNESIKEKKPRTKVEYVKCEFSREWEAVKYYNEEGELFVIDCNGNYSNVNDISGAWYEVVCKNLGSLYRAVHIDIDWRDDAIYHFNTTPSLHEDDRLIDLISKSATKQESDAFIKLCHLVSSLNSVN